MISCKRIPLTETKLSISYEKACYVTYIAENTLKKALFYPWKRIGSN